MESCHQLIASLVDSLIWPGVVVALVIVFRTRVGKLIDKVVSIRFGDNRVDFGGVLDDARQLADKLENEPASVQLTNARSPRDASGALRRASGVVGPHPRTAITNASLVVDDELDAAVERLRIPVPRGIRPTPEGSWARLRYWGHLNEDWVTLLRQIYRLQREAESTPQSKVSAEQARNFVDLCSRVVEHLQELGAPDSSTEGPPNQGERPKPE